VTTAAKTATAVAIPSAAKPGGGVQAKAVETRPAIAHEGGGVMRTVHGALASPAQPLDPAMRAFMEARFRHDFSRIRVHSGTQAARSTDALRAQAFTIGGHIVLGNRLSNETGRRFTMAHELAHAIQQDRAPASGHFKLGAENSEQEIEADRAARAILAGKGAPGIFSRAANNVVMRLSGGAIAGIVAGSIVGAAAIAGLIAGLVIRSRRLMHWETRVANAALVGDPAASPPAATALLAENTRLSVIGDTAEHPRVEGGQNWVHVRVMLGPAANQEGWIRQEQIESRPETEELSPEQARQVFDALSHSSMRTSTGGSAPIPFGYPANGCYSRAQEMSDILTQLGFASEKVFALAGKRPLAVRSSNDDPSLTGNTAEPDNTVSWTWHVAPMVRVRDPERGVIETVLDPSMGPAPMTLEQWETLMTEGDTKRRTWARLSLSEVRQRLDEGTINAYDSSVTVAPRDTYNPGDIDRDRSHQFAEQEEERSRPTMTDYTQREPAAQLAAVIRQQLQNAVIVLSAILDAIRRTAHAARQRFLQIYGQLLQRLHARLRQEENQQVDEELNR
jgi:hypothetical protein